MNEPEHIIVKKLWSESVGYCMNPSCECNLIPTDSSIGERAHIIPKAENGDFSYENLILLCRNCHKLVDDGRLKNPDGIVKQLINWRVVRQRQIRQMFSKKFQIFEELREEITPLLVRNNEIFNDYGPNNSNPNFHRLWLEFEPELIANNSKIEFLLSANKHLLPENQKQIVSDFRKHAREFLQTRGPEAIVRLNLFPVGLLAIFGIKQNQQENPTESSNEVRPEKLEFFQDWLENNGIRYEINHQNRFLELTLNERFNVVLRYIYYLTASDLDEMDLSEGLIVVNLYNWHDKCVTNEARKYAELFDVKVFMQNEFFSFAHRNIK